MPPPSVVDLEAAPTFDECIKNLPHDVPDGSNRGKEVFQPSLLANEGEAVAYLQLVISDQDLKSLWPNKTDVLVSNVFFDLGKVLRRYTYFYFLDPNHITS